MTERRATVLWLAVAGLVFASAALWSRSKSSLPPLSDWQAPVSSLTDAQQRHLELLRAAITEAERVRSGAQWPASLSVGWPLRRRALFVTAVGDAAGLRWLVMFQEPDPALPPERAPADDVHHPLADGTMLHVTIWTRPSEGPFPEDVVAFPAAEGWVERVRR